MDNNDLISPLYRKEIDIPSIITGNRGAASGRIYESLTHRGAEGEQLVANFKTLSDAMKAAQDKIGMNHEEYRKWKETGRNFREELATAAEFIQASLNAEEAELAARIHALKALEDNFSAFYKRSIDQFRSLTRATMKDKAAAMVHNYNSLATIFNYNWSDLKSRVDLQVTQLRDQRRLDPELEKLAKALEGSESPKEDPLEKKFRENKLTPYDIALLLECKKFSVINETDKKFIDLVNLMYLETITDDQLGFFRNTITASDDMKEALVRLVNNRREFREAQDRNLVDLITSNLSDWQARAELSPNGLFLISRHTEAGSALRTESETSLLFEYGVRSIIVTDTGKVLMRRLNDRILGGGGFKAVYEVEGSTGNKYAWYVLKDKSTIETYNSPAVSALRKFIIENPNASFNQVGEFVEHGAKGVGIGELYDGSAESLRRKLGQPVLKGQHIIDLVSSLALLHRSGIAHRDIKPANILLKDGKPYLHDYDLVTLLSGNTNVQARGTPDFMPMEFVNTALHKDVLPRMLPKADVFAMARTLILDQQPEMEGETRGFDSYEQYINMYLKEMCSALLNINIPGDLRNLLRGAVFEPRKIQFLLMRRRPEEQLTFIQAFLNERQAKHESLAPNDLKPFLQYRRLLWEALSPDPAKRPDTEQFLARLQVLQTAGQLPT